MEPERQDPYRRKAMIALIVGFRSRTVTCFLLLLKETGVRPGEEEMMFALGREAVCHAKS